MTVILRSAKGSVYLRVASVQIPLGMQMIHQSSSRFNGSIASVSSQRMELNGDDG